MRKIFVLISTAFLLMPGHILASDLEDPTRSALCQSWMPPKKDEGYKDLGTHNDMYLYYKVKNIEEWAFRLIEKFLITYCSLVIDEKEYVIIERLENRLEKLDSYSLASATSYQKLSDFSKRWNERLPARETFVLGQVRRFFSYCWPTIDMFDAVEKIRKIYPVSADYIDFLFKTNAPGVTIETIKAAATKNCSEPLNSAEMLTLFAMHTFGHGNMQDLDLAKQEMEILRKSQSPEAVHIIYHLIKAFKTLEEKKSAEPRMVLNESCEGLIFSDSEPADILSDSELIFDE